jgi:hypothetical protein
MLELGSKLLRLNYFMLKRLKIGLTEKLTIGFSKNNINFKLVKLMKKP